MSSAAKVSVDVAAGSSDASSTPSSPGARDTYLDVLRTAAIARVILLHTLWVNWVTFVLPSMGLMFGLGGALMAQSIERRGWKAVLKRFQRLLPPLWVLAAVMVPLMIMGGWRAESAGAHPFSWWSLASWVVPFVDPVGSDRFDHVWRVLWYLRAYAWFLLLSPVLLRMFRRWPLAMVAMPLGATLVVPEHWFSDGGHWQSGLGDLFAYGACWITGFARLDGHLDRLSRRMWMMAVGVCGVVGAVLLAMHWGEHGLEVTSHPALNAFWSYAFVLFALRLRPSMVWLEVRTVAARFVGWVNARAMTVYLWHTPAILVAGELTGRAGTDSLASTPARATLVSMALLLLVMAITALNVGMFGWVEDVARVPVRRRARAPVERR